MRRVSYRGKKKMGGESQGLRIDYASERGERGQSRMNLAFAPEEKKRKKKKKKGAGGCVLLSRVR